MLRKWRTEWLKFTRLEKKREHWLKPNKEKSPSRWSRQLQSFVIPDLCQGDCSGASPVLTMFYSYRLIATIKIGKELVLNLTVFSHLGNNFCLIFNYQFVILHSFGSNWNKLHFDLLGLTLYDSKFPIYLRTYIWLYLVQ